VGFLIDEGLNRSQRLSSNHSVVDISASSSRVKVLAVKTFEELIMARQCRDVVEKLKNEGK
jgi:acetate kinase